MKTQIENWILPASALVCMALGASVILRAEDPPKYSPWSAAVNLGPVVNTAGNDAGPCISRDGLSLYFNSDRPGGFGLADIYVARRASAGDPWSGPVNLGPNVNTASADQACALSSDEHWLFFNSNRPQGFGLGDLYVTRRHNRRSDSGWLAAQNLGPAVNTAAIEAFPTYYEDEATGKITIYFSSNRPGGQGGMDIYAITLQPDGSWSAPAPVLELNSAFDDVQPNVRRDGLELFMSSNRPGSLGVYDVWVSTRAGAADPWGTPINLGPVVNSPAPAAQGRPALSFDGTVLYFYSSRPGGFGSNDIYMSTRSRLKE